MGTPLIEFPDADLATYAGNGYCVTKKKHSMYCYFCDSERLKAFPESL